MKTLTTSLLTALLLAIPSSADVPVARLEVPADLPADLKERFVAAGKAYTVQDLEARLAAVAEIGRIPDPLAARWLAAIAAGDGHPEVRLKAVEGLEASEMKGWQEAAIPILAWLFPDAYRARAAELVSKSPDAATLALLRQALAKGLPKQHPSDRIGMVFSSNDVETIVGRHLAARALGRIGGDESIGALRAALDDKEWEIRAAAAHSLGDTGDAGSVSHLVAATKDKDLDVQVEAVIALGRIGGAAAVEALRKLGKHREALVAAMAAKALQLAQAPRAAGEVPPFPDAEGSKDIVYIADATFSMQMTQDGLRHYLQKEIDRTRDNPETRYGFVWYRDYNNQFTTQSSFLSYDPAKVALHVQKYHATGAQRSDGGALDVALGIAAALNWRERSRDRERGAGHEVRVIADYEPKNDDLAALRAKLLHDADGTVVNVFCLNNSEDQRGPLRRIAKDGGGTWVWLPKNTVSKMKPDQRRTPR